MSNKPVLKDYLHLYLGCEIRHDTGKYVGTLTGVGFHTANIFCDYFKRNEGHRVPVGKDFGYFDILIERLKPVLRKLSSMTAKEKQIADINHEGGILITHFETMRYLLKEGFDLFQLIESGLAVDRATIKL